MVSLFRRSENINQLPFNTLPTIASNDFLLIFGCQNLESVDVLQLHFFLIFNYTLRNFQIRVV